MHKIIRTSTIPESLFSLLKGQLNFLAKKYHIVGISSSGEYLEKTSIREEIPIIGIEMERGISPIKDLKSLWKLYQTLKKEKPMVVHSITPKAGLLTMLASKLANVPIRIHTFTGLIFPTKEGMIKHLLIIMDKILCWSATNIYPEGNGVKEDLIKYRITTKPLKVLANGNVNGIDLDFFNPNLFSSLDKERLKSKHNISLDDFVFVFVGRLVKDKGINDLVEAFKSIQGKNVKLILVGSKEEKLDPLKVETLKEIEENPNIIEVGFQKDVRPYFSISDALVFPSYREGFPNVVLQAGAMGLPSIVTNISGSNEIILEGINGTIVSVKSPNELKSKMELFKSNLDYYLMLKNNSRGMIESRYKQEVVWNALLAEYEELINQHHSK